MKFELEVLDADLEDRKVIIEMRAALEEKIKGLSSYAQNNLVNQLNWLRGNVEDVENQWLKWQQERCLNKLSQVLNVGRGSLGDKEWHDS